MATIDPSRIRAKLGQVRSVLKQGKALPAVMAVQEGLVGLIGGQLLKSERSELEQLVEDAVMLVSNDSEVRKHFPIKLEYVPGQERELHALMRDVIEAFSTATVDGAHEHMKQREERKIAMFENGVQALDNSNIEKARALFKAIINKYDDPVTYSDIAEIFTARGYYEDAIPYYAAAIEMKPDLYDLYNRIGIALRKMKSFEPAERYYALALQYSNNDPDLLFNMGRLYIDWKKWAKAAKIADAALRYRPDFPEALQMLQYAQKKLEDQKMGYR